MGLVSGFIKFNQRLSLAFDKLLPRSMTVFGTTDFHASLLPKYIEPDWMVYDIGGGKRPFITKDWKSRDNITQIGIDIDESELKKAPDGDYDHIMVEDITSYRGKGDGDAVVSRSTLEHVKHTKPALKGMASTLKPGGIIIAFAPCRNALFAKLNLIIPEKPKHKLLAAIYGEQAKVMGFKAYYDDCSPSRMEKNIKDLGLEIVERRIYWMSNYFMVFAPFHILWRIYQLIMRKAGMDDLCEGFAYVLRKPEKG